VGEKTLESADYEIQPSEHGPLSYIAGYVVSKLNKASKGKSGEEKPEFQALLQSLIVSEEEVTANSYQPGQGVVLLPPARILLGFYTKQSFVFEMKLTRLMSFESFLWMQSAFRLSACPLSSRCGKILCSGLLE
jgi:hypothetical protein